MNGKATQHLASRVTPDLIGGPAATVGSGCPIESGMTIGGSSSVTPDLIGGPVSTVGPGCPIKSGMTGGASGMTVSGVELLYRDQYPAVHHMLQRRVGNPEDAADLAQEAFLRLMRYDNHSLESLRFLVMTQ